MSLTPSGDEAEVRRRLEETEEATAFRIRHGRLPLAGLDEIAPVLDALAGSGGAAAAEDFRPILRAARAADAVAESLARSQSPHLTRHAGRLPAFGDILSDASRLFGADGLLRDDASSELSAIRSRLRRRRRDVSAILEKLLDQRRDSFGDAVVVLRNDRYCLPVLAAARGRVPGIVHDRSGSGQTVFVEPMEVIEPNNELALLASEDRREAERILTAFGKSVLAREDDLLAAVEELAELDALEARVAFGEIGEARLPEISDDGAWTLVGARHPLLDRRFEALRRRVLDPAREGRDAVPLDMELSPERRLLVVSGPNAGGKTVVLKTAGLFSMLAQCGIPVPAAAGTRLPVFAAIRTEIGDAQAILSDRSTFSSSMETLAAILDAAGPGTLALIDEIGGATDPEEGSALAVAFLEEYLARGGRAIVSTHLSAIKSFAAGRPDALCAAMEFDEATGRPNFRLHAGLAGRSRALSVARERGIPESVLDRARQILGEAWQRRESAETDAEKILERLREKERELAREQDEARQAARSLADERAKTAAERSKMLAEGRAGFERARGELLRRVEEELDRTRRESTRLAQASAARVLSEAATAASGSEDVLAEAKEAAEALSRRVEPGGRARVRSLGAEGRVVSFEGDWAHMEIQGKRLRVRRGDLEPAGAGGGRRKAAGADRGIGSASRLTPTTSPDDAAGDVREVHLIGQRLEEAIEAAEKALDQALLAGASRLRLIHGHGTGRLRDGLREHFRRHGAVASLRSGDRSEGGNGATILELR